MDSKNHQVIIFSKDRAMQLHGTLASLLLFCEEASALKVKILFAASSEKFKEAYRKVEEEFLDLLDIVWVNEDDFRRDLLRLISGQPDSKEGAGCCSGWINPQYDCEFTTFLVDDNLFVRNFSVEIVHRHLNEYPRSIGFSLRLGRNTTYCYSLNCPQEMPKFREPSDGVLQYDWPGCEADFGYPLEVSSSTYRTGDVFRMLRWLPFSNPNTLEGRMAKLARLYKWRHPSIHCFANSVAFCVPVNKVQEIADNRAGDTSEYSSEHLNELFLEGYRIDVPQLEGFISKSCHEEIELPLRPAS